MKTIALLLVLFASASSAAAQSALKVLTLNTNHGGQAPWSVANQVAAIVAQAPDVVFLQEAAVSQLDEYVSGINAGLSTTAWHGAAARHCVSGDAPVCSSPSDEAVMVLSRFPFIEIEPRLIWARDDFLAARGVLRAALQLDDRTIVQAFACHLPALADAVGARATWVAAFRAWADTVRDVRIIGGDFNDRPSSPAVAAMASAYIDAWGSAGSGGGATHAHDNRVYTSRIDYLFSSSGAEVLSAWVPDVTISDHRPVVASYRVASNPAVAPVDAAASPAGELVLMTDDFEGGARDLSKWPGGVLSGTMQDVTLPVAQSGGAVVIGPLFANASGFRYIGASAPPFDLTDSGYAQVDLVQGVTGEAANAMFTVAGNSTNFYRIYQTGAAGAQRLAVEKKLDDTKYPLAAAPYDPSAPRTLRIRHDNRPAAGIDDVVFELSAAPVATPNGTIGAANASAGAADYVEVYREPWDARIDVRSLTFELKAGTSDKESSPGTVVWDNFRAALARPSVR